MKRINHTRKHEKGQVLLMAVLIMAVLLIAVLLLVDIQRIIRGKVTVMSGIDAAAIAGATWQKHTLNLIGELNLIKACTVIISDSTYGIGQNPDSYIELNASPRSSKRRLQQQIRRIIRQRDKLQTEQDLLTAMQVRISFIGPLIGFGAAQQTAKNNKMPSNDSCNEYMEALLNFVRDDNYYGDENIAPQTYHGYAWRQPYGDMLEKLLDSKIAVGTNVEHIGMPHLDSPSQSGRALQYKIILEAIDSNDWCILQSILAKDMDFSGKWWGDIQIEKRQKFLGCSEILPIHTSYVTGESAYNMAKDGGFFPTGKTPLSDVYNQTNIVTEATENEKNRQYDREWRRNHDLVSVGGKVYCINWEDSDKKLNPLPDITWCIFNTSYWKSYSDAQISNAEWEQYLHGRFKTATDYHSGALSYFSVYVPNRSILNQFQSSDLSLGRKKGTNYLSSHFRYITFNATAKPFGHLKDQNNTVYYPFEAGLILPVFDKVALIPISLEKASGFPMADYDWMIYLTKYLPALGTVDSIDAVESAMDTDHFERIKNRGWHALIKKLDDPVWRQQGIGWLDTPVWKYVERQRITGYNADGTPITESYYEKIQDGTNRDHCFDWNGGGGNSSGGRWGPGSLH